MTDPTRSLAVLQRLHELGLRLAVDDYGAGYSSLTYLAALPVSDLKIDKSFVIAMAGDGPSAQRACSIITSTIALANALGLDVIAEGVETERVLTQITQLGCAVAQGYHLSRPLPAGDFDTWIEGREHTSAGARSAATLGLGSGSPAA